MKPFLIFSFLIGAATSVAGAEMSHQQIVAPEFMQPAGSRTFSIEYVGKISEAPKGTKKLRVWMPAPQESAVQSIRDLRFSLRPRITTEPKYGNKIAYWEIDQPAATNELKMSFVCERKVVILDLAKLATDGADSSAAPAVFTGPDKLVLVDDEMRKLSAKITAGKQTTLEKARAIYDYVLANMSYDKNHPGWGTGSTRHACDVGKGNCTDFHALFNSLCRAQGIASGFEIGLYLPYEKGRRSAVIIAGHFSACRARRGFRSIARKPIASRTKKNFSSGATPAIA